MTPALPQSRWPQFCLFLAALLLLGGCHSSKKNVTPGSDGPVVIEIQGQRLSGEQKKLLAEVRTWIGTPYQYAHEEKGVGTDCSGMVMQVYLATTGKKLPRNSAKQAEYCRRIKPSEVVPGDLVFFATGRDSGKVTHVGIMIDAEQFVHASSSKGVVVSKISAPYYSSRLLMFGRID